MADPVFGAPIANPFDLTDVGSFASPIFADIEGDGDLDAFVDDRYGETRFFRNSGSAAAGSFVSEASNFGLTDVGNKAGATFADIDGDSTLFVTNTVSPGVTIT